MTSLEKNIEKQAKKKAKKKITKKIKYRDYEFYWYLTPIAIPIYHIVNTMNKYDNWKYNRMVWDEEKAIKIIEIVLPKIGEHENGAIWYSTKWWDTIWWNNSPRRYREWANKHRNKIKDFIVEKYEPAGFEKIVEVDKWDASDKWVGFRKI
jgi:hypothetical protein